MGLSGAALTIMLKKEDRLAVTMCDSQLHNERLSCR